jgi:hypothetical protein
VGAVAENSSNLGSRTEETHQSDLLSQKEATALVNRFAPTLLFHPDERYFPCSPVFPLDGEHNRGISGQARLGTAEYRNASYLALSLEEKAELARVYYRVRYLRQGPEEGLIIDYWLYYIWNKYRVRGGLFPVWFDRSHPNDLEHIHLVLRKRIKSGPEVDDRTAQTPFSLEAVYSSAHEGTVPANRFYPSSQDFPARPHFLVELGSHASALDTNNDGLFTPGVDGRSGYKLLWGVRDRGITWTRYSPSYAYPRSEKDAIVFSPRSGVLPDDSPVGLSYRLVAADELSDQFAELGMTAEQRKEIFEAKIHWLERVIGKSNGESNKLLNPPDPDAQGDSVGLNGFSSTERGVLLGGTSLADAPGLFLGGRYSVLHGVSYLPDLIFEFDGILTTRGKGYLSPQFSLAYPISVSTKLMGGVGLLTDTIDFSNRQWDWLAGLEVRLGHVQIYGGFRTSGSVNDEVIDIRLAYFF